MTYPFQISVNVGGSVTTASYGSDRVRALPATEWSSISGAYQMFRVHAIRLHVAGVTGTADVGCLAVAPWHGNTAPGTYSSLLTIAGAKLYSLSPASPPILHEVRGRTDRNTLIWSSVGTAIPNENQFGVAFSSDTVLAPSSTIGAAFLEFIVEFGFVA